MASEVNALTDFVEEQDLIVLVAVAVIILVLSGVCCCTRVCSGIARKLGCRSAVRECSVPPVLLCLSSFSVQTFSPFLPQESPSTAKDAKEQELSLSSNGVKREPSLNNPMAISRVPASGKRAVNSNGAMLSLFNKQGPSGEDSLEGSQESKREAYSRSSQATPSKGKEAGVPSSSPGLDEDAAQFLREALILSKKELADVKSRFAAKPAPGKGGTWTLDVLLQLLNAAEDNDDFSVLVNRPISLPMLKVLRSKSSK